MTFNTGEGMRDKPIHVTQTLRRQWDSRGGMKLPLDEVLGGAVPVTDYSGYYGEPTNGAVLWEHPAEPTCGFLVKREEIRDVVIGVLNKRKCRAIDCLTEGEEGGPVYTFARQLERRVAKLEQRVVALEKELAETELVD